MTWNDEAPERAEKFRRALAQVHRERDYEAEALAALQLEVERLRREIARVSQLNDELRASFGIYE